MEFHFKRLTADRSFTTPFDEIIASVTRGKVSHVETLVAGRFFTADMHEDRVLSRDALDHQGEAAYWQIVPVEAVADYGVVDWTECRIGLKYDYAGALSAALNSGMRDAFKEFCSGLAYGIASRAGMLDLTPYPNPQTLLNDLQRHRGEPLTSTYEAGEMPRLGEEHFALLDNLRDNMRISADLLEAVRQTAG